MKKTLFKGFYALCLLLLCSACSRAQQSLPALPAYQNGFTFKVHDVKPSKDTIWTTDYKEMVKNSFCMVDFAQTNFDSVVIESFSRDRRHLAGCRNNGFFETVHRAYGQHHPLVLSPDVVWLAIAQGFSRHVDQNAEQLRHHFVQHEGKKALVVDMTGKVRIGDDASRWEEVVLGFHEEIAKNTVNPELAKVIAGRFSGTHIDAAVAFDMTLMNSMQPYFDYWGRIICGIPTVTLEGTPEDWAAIETRAAFLAQYDLKWWTDALQPVLAEFTRASKGQPNVDFWKGIVRNLEEPTCGGDEYVNGWITVFYPYLYMDKKYVRNPLLGLDPQSLYTIKTSPPRQELEVDANGKGKRKDPTQYYIDGITVAKKSKKSRKIAPENTTSPKPADNDNILLLCTGQDEDARSVHYTGPRVTTDHIPNGVLTTILNVDNNGQLMVMDLKSGFFGTRQEEKTMALRPVIGWAVVHDRRKKPDSAAIKNYEIWKQNKQ
jgi:Domain of unknown function (DUF4419)